MLNNIFLIIIAVSGVQGLITRNDIIFSRPASTTVRATITNASAYVALGYRELSTSTFPSEVIMCDIGANSCSPFTCSATTNCIASSGILTGSVASGTLTINRTTTSGVAIDPVMMYIAWINPTSIAGASVAAADVQSQTWQQFATPFPPLDPVTITQPPFAYTFTRKSDNNLGVSLVMATGKSIILAWRQTPTERFGRDGVICKEGSSGSCVQFICSSATTCTAPVTEQTFITNTNTIDSTGANFVRGMNLGSAPIDQLLPMYLAYSVIDSPVTVLATAAQGVTWSFFTAPVPDFVETIWPFPVTMSRPSSSTLAITIVQPSGQMVLMGWRKIAPDSFFPTSGLVQDGIICSQTGSSCVQFTCSAYATCTTAANSFLTTNTSGPTVMVVRDLTAGKFPIDPALKMNMMWDTAATAPTPAATDAQSRDWKFYSLYAPDYKPTEQKPTFPVTFTRPTLTTLGITLLPGSNKTVWFGWRDPKTEIVRDGFICSSQFQDTCLQFSCTSTTVCAAPTASFLTSNAALGPSVTVTRSLPAGSLPIDPSMMMNLVWDIADAQAAPTIASAQNRSTWKYYSELAPPYIPPTSEPTVPIVFTRTSQTTLGISLEPGVGRTLWFGWRESLTEMFPRDGVICSPSSSITCFEFSCSSVSSCLASSILTVNTASNSSAVLQRNMTAGSFPLTNASNDMFLAWDIAATPQSYVTPTAEAAQSRNWRLYTAPLPAFNTFIVVENPTIPIKFSRSSDTAIEITLTPGEGQTVWFGWRTAPSILWPTDVVICAPSSVSTCLDVVCTDIATCTQRTQTILLGNSASGSSATFSRNLAAGGAPLSSNASMHLAYATAATVTGTTTLNAASAQNKTWNLYTQGVPSTNSAGKYIPTLICAVLVLLSIA